MPVPTIVDDPSQAAAAIEKGKAAVDPTLGGEPKQNGHAKGAFEPVTR